MLRFFRILIEWIAALIGVGAVTFFLLVWWLTSQPLSSTALAPYIASAIGRFAPDTKVEVGGSLLAWDNADLFVVLKSQNIKLRDKQDHLIAEIPAMKLKASPWGLVQGKFIPAELNIAQPHLWFVRKADGQLMFGDMNATGGAADPNAEKIPVREGLQRTMSAVVDESLLQDLQITQAELSVHDEATEQDWQVAIPEVALHRGWRSLTGRAKIAIAQPDGNASLEADYVYDSHDKEHDVILITDKVNLSFLARHYAAMGDAAMLDLPLSGKITVKADAALNIVAAEAKVEGGPGRLVAEKFWDAPRAVKALSLTASYDKATEHLTIPAGQFDLDGPQLDFKLEGKASKSVAPNGKPYDMDFALTLELRDLPMDDFSSVWPRGVVPGARDWISRNMSKGQFTQGEVNLGGHFAWDDLNNMVMDSGGGKVSARDGRVTYIPGMPPVENVGADATFDLDHMDVRLTGGGIGALKLQPSTIQLTDFQAHVQNIVIPLQLAGPIRDVIKLMDAPPLGYAKAIGLRADDGDGRLEGGLELRFPLLNAIEMKDVKIKADAKLIDFAAAKLVPGMAISQGNLELKLNDDGFLLEGPAALNGVPLQVKYEGAFKSEEGKPQYLATVNGNVAGEQWRQLGLAALAKSEGPTVAGIKFAQFGKGLSQLSGSFDFKQVALQVDELGWKKAAGVPAVFNFDADLPKGKPVTVKNLALQGSGVKAKGKAVLDGDSMRPLSVELMPLTVGRTNANIRFKQEAGDNGAMRVSIEGQSFDLSGLKGDGKDKDKTKPAAPANPKPMDFTLKLNKLFTSANGIIANAAGHARRDALGWQEIDLHGLADGEYPMAFALKPTTPDPNGPRTLNITSSNFGRLLKGMGFTDTVEGGELTVSGQSEPDHPRVISGKLKIATFTVSNLPAMVRLLNAVSPFGFMDLITGKATLSNMRGRFRWDGDVIELKSVRASGAVFGLNIDGQVDIASGNSALRGTVVPFSFFNRVINEIPLLGNVITGGEGQGIIAAAYTIKGPLDSPDISVNPVSLLTPGFLRTLFFSGDEGDVELPPAQPEAEPEAVSGGAQK